MPATSPPNSDLRPSSPVAALCRGGVVLLVVLGLAAVLLGLFVWQQQVPYGIASVALAFGICFVAGLAAYALAVYTVGTPQAMPGMMGGMLFRTGLPIVAGILGITASSQLKAAGFMGHCLVLFLVGLVCEVILNLRLIQSADRLRATRQSTGETGNHIATVL